MRSSTWLAPSGEALLIHASLSDYDVPAVGDYRQYMPENLFGDRVAMRSQKTSMRSA